MSDKYNRIEALADGAKNEVHDEAITDTLMDLSNYALMTMVEIERERLRQTSSVAEDGSHLYSQMTLDELSE
jgi:hypothetical protein